MPHTLRVSSLTEEGMDGLKAAVFDLMKASDWAAQVRSMQSDDATALTGGPAGEYEAVL